MEAEPGTFFLTDFLARHFEPLVVEGLGLDRFPQLRDDYFGHYSRLVYLAQTDDPAITAMAEAAASRLGLAVRASFYRSRRPSIDSCAARNREKAASWPSLTIVYWRDIPSEVIVRQGAKLGQARAPRALHQRDRRRGDARARLQRRRLLRANGGAASRSPAATISRPKRAPPPRASRRNTIAHRLAELAKREGREA